MRGPAYSKAQGEWGERKAEHYLEKELEPEATCYGDAYNKYGAAIVNGVAGIVVLPDNWVLPSGLSFKHSFDYSQNTYDNASWSKMEEAGAVFKNI